MRELYQHFMYAFYFALGCGMGYAAEPFGNREFLAATNRLIYTSGGVLLVSITLYLMYMGFETRRRKVS